MLPKLPVVSGRDLIKFLKKLGYEVVRQGESCKVKKRNRKWNSQYNNPLS